jgi:hypothetical protein
MSNKLPAAIDLAAHNAGHCLDRAEFFATKSTASYAETAAKGWQTGAESWATVEELLRELAQYRNACITRRDVVAEVAQGMKSQGYDY